MGIHASQPGQLSGDITVLFNDANHTFTQQERYRAGPGLFDLATDATGTIVISQLHTVGAVAVPSSSGLSD